MKKDYFLFGIIGLLLILAAISNPGSEVHKKALKSKVDLALHKSMQEITEDHNSLWAELGQAIGMALGGKISGEIVEQVVSVDNYIFFSITKITWDGEPHAVGIGIFGNVYLHSKLEDEIESIIINQDGITINGRKK